MSASGYTPIQLYYSTTAAAVPVNTNLASGELAINITDGKLYYKNNSNVVTLLAAAAAATGTVSSVAQSFTGGLISVAGSPITTSGTLALTVAGTSGGIPYFSSSSTWASSTALAASALVIGGGAGAAPSTTTTGTGVVTALGVNTGTAGAFVVNGGALGTPSSGTVTNLTGTASININGTVGATTASSGAFTTLSASGTTTLSGNQIISVTDNTNAALRVTQLGTGNALLVEDSTNPDASPFVVTADGRFIHGHTSALSPRSVTFANQFIGSDFSGSAPLSLRYSNDASPTGYEFSKTRSTTPSGNAIVSSGDSVGQLIFSADDGTQYVQAANITAAVDGTPGTNDMPGRLVFSTTADGASTPTERMRIGSSGNVGIGGTSSASYLSLSGTLPVTSADSIGVNLLYTIPSTSTTSSRGFFTQTVSTQATAFTLPTFRHFEAGSVTVGAGSTLTEQVGFRASALSGATNNYGFVGAVASAVGAWNLYMSGTANNYMAGNLSIGTTTSTSMLQVNGSSSVSAFKTPNIAEVDTISATAATGTINYDVTTQSVLYYTSNASANWTVNFRGSSGTSLNTLMQTGESISATFLVTQGATAYYNSAVQVDGSSVTPKWQGGTAPTSGNASSIDSYTYVIIKTGSAAFTVLASITKFA